MGRARVLFASAVALLTAGAAPAIAAPPWSAPESVSSPAPFISAPQVLVDVQGRALATWERAGAFPDPKLGFVFTGRLAPRAAGALEFDPEREAPRFAAGPLEHRAGRVLGLERLDADEDRRDSRLYSRAGSTSGAFAPRREIAWFDDPGFPPSLAVHRYSVAAWIEDAPRGRRVVRASLRRPGGAFGSPVTLSRRGRATDVVAGAGPGRVLVAWERAGRVEARVKRPGRRWGRTQRLGPAKRFATSFSVRFSGRRAYLAWLAESAESAVLRAAVLPAGRTRFRGPQTIDRIRHQAPTDPHPVAIAPLRRNGALLAWTGWDGQRFRARAAAAGRRARFGAPADVSPPGEAAVLGDAESDRRGAVLAVWSRLDAVGEVGDRVRAALRPPGGAFGAPEDVSDLDRARLPAVAYDSKARRWVAVWSQRVGPDGPSVPPEQITTYLRSATRPG